VGVQAVNMESLNISNAAFAYLVLQRGALDDMKGDPQTWCSKYIEVLCSEFEHMQGLLPDKCNSILDVGSGLGGIDAILNDHYGGDCQITLLDGVDDPPEVSSHRLTFNNMKVAGQFLEMNGVRHFDFIDANDPARSVKHTYDLIVSFKSWCFHFEAERHLDLVLSACHPGTMLIVDIRGGRNANLFDDAAAEKCYNTMRLLSKHFKHLGMVHYGVKHETHRYEAR